MNKKDLIPVIILVALIPVWYLVDQWVFVPQMRQKLEAQAKQAREETTDAASFETNGVPSSVSIETNTVAIVAAPDLPVVEDLPPAQEFIETIGNETIRLELTSIGGGIKSVTLQAKNKKGEFLYPLKNEKNSAPMVIDFSDFPALAYEADELGLSAETSYALVKSDDGKSVTLTKDFGSLLVERTIALDENYLLKVKDRFISKVDQPVSLPSMRILTGRMKNPEDTQAMKGLSILGVDSHTADGQINYWGRKLTKLYKSAGQPAELEGVVLEGMANTAVDWVSAKNMFFAQILSPGKASATMEIWSQKDGAEKGSVLENVSAALVFKKEVIDAGKALERNYTYYVGPKSYSILKAADKELHFEGVMEFKTIGFWKFMNILMEPSRKALLWTLNLLNGLCHNYGVAIILLTFVVRVLFWPLTHKSTESMKRMQELQPQIKAIQAKYKSNPQRMQQETMALYKENKVNPMGGCLPMLLQMPVLFALFSVLRNAIELRYSSFLWISDLSSPENLFAGAFKIPLLGWDALNILPIVMTGSMIWQQKLSAPSTAAATPEQLQQQKMMMYMMPIMMLFFFYTMPSGLTLYWTTSNLLMIAQTSIRNMRKKMADA